MYPGEPLKRVQLGEIGHFEMLQDKPKSTNITSDVLEVRLAIMILAGLMSRCTTGLVVYETPIVFNTTPKFALFYILDLIDEPGLG